MSKKININWNMVAQAIMTLIATLASAITLNSKHDFFVLSGDKWREKKILLSDKSA